MNPALSEKLNRVVNKRSADPRASENCLDPDWQAGYFTGSLDNKHELHEWYHPISVEARRRGISGHVTPEFKSWKQGYWAGVFNHL